MEIKKHIIQKHIHDIAIDQLAEEYLEKGYKIFKEEKIGKYRADLIAKKGHEIIVFEVKAGKITPEGRETVRGISEYIKNMGGNDYKFKLVVATPPREKKILIAEIDEILNRYLEGNPPEKLASLSTDTRVEEVGDVEVDELTIEDDASVHIKGNGIVVVTLQFASNSRDEIESFSHDYIPFDFDLICHFGENHKLILDKVKSLDVDTSSF